MLVLGSVRVKCWLSNCVAEICFRTDCMCLFFQAPPPAQIIWKVFCCDPSESLYPILQATVISVDVLNMINLVYHTAAFSPDQTDMLDFFQVGKRSVSLVPIVAKDSILCNDWFQHLGHRKLAKVTKHPVGHLAMTVPGDQDRNLLSRQTTLRAARGSFRAPLDDSKKKVSSASTIPLRLRSFLSFSVRRKR